MSRGVLRGGGGRADIVGEAGCAETLSAEEFSTFQDLYEGRDCFLCLVQVSLKSPSSLSSPLLATVHMQRKSLQPQLPTNLQKKRQAVITYQCSSLKRSGASWASRRIWFNKAPQALLCIEAS